MILAAFWFGSFLIGMAIFRGEMGSCGILSYFLMRLKYILILKKDKKMRMRHFFFYYGYVYGTKPRLVILILPHLIANHSCWYGLLLYC